MQYNFFALKNRIDITEQSQFSTTSEYSPNKKFLFFTPNKKFQFVDLVEEVYFNTFLLFNVTNHHLGCVRKEGLKMKKTCPHIRLFIFSLKGSAICATEPLTDEEKIEVEIQEQKLLAMGIEYKFKEGEKPLTDEELPMNHYTPKMRSIREYPLLKGEKQSNGEVTQKKEEVDKNLLPVT